MRHCPSVDINRTRSQAIAMDSRPYCLTADYGSN